MALQFKRGTTEQWVAKNPVLASGQPGYDTDTGDLKIGNGVDRYGDLPVVGGLDGLQIVEVTQEEYDDIPSPRPSNILYIITP